MSNSIDDLLDKANAYCQKVKDSLLADQNDDKRPANRADELDGDNIYSKNTEQLNYGDLSALPNFSFPTTSIQEIQTGKLGEIIEIKENKTNGRGLYAKQDLKAGTRLVVAKPLALVMDRELDDFGEDDEDDEGEDVDYEEIISLDKDSDSEDVACDAADSDDEDSVPTQKKRASENNIIEISNDKTTGLEDEEEDPDEAEPTGTIANGILTLRLLKSIKENPSLWTEELSQLFPRDSETAVELPPWMCKDATIGMEIERQMSSLQSLSLFGNDDGGKKGQRMNEEICQDIQLRLPLIVRYNVLSVETSSDLFVYPDVERGGLALLAGTGLYGPEVSYFNHSHVPNVSRYCIGDVMFFVTNRDVTKGDELCFSYIEHELLCENATKRTALLGMDFSEHDGSGKSDSTISNKKRKRNNGTASSLKEDSNKEDVTFPVVDDELQNELLSMTPHERLPLIEELLDQKTTYDPDQDYLCDQHNLHTLHAITLDAMGESSKALSEWETCVDFAVKHFPPLDENTVSLRVQAALCAINGKQEVVAKNHAKEALRIHDLLFGGGVKRLRKRYEKEFGVQLRPRTTEEVSADVDMLWPCLNN